MSAKTLRVLTATALLIVVCLGVTGCSPEKQTAAKLHGVWYEDQTGQQYEFISDTQLVLPTTLSNGSNAVTYQVVGADKISMSQADVVHVLDITKLDSTELDTRDAAATTTNKYFRNLDDTAWARNRAAIVSGALGALKNFPNITPAGQIIWVSPEPTDTADVWKTWPTSSMQRYAKAWSWSDVTRNESVALVASGTAGSEGYAVDFNRTVPAQATISSLETASSRLVTGAAHIAVGYSASMTDYSAGQFFYLNKQLFYSLGGGYAISVHVGPTVEYGFAPATHS